MELKPYTILRADTQAPCRVYVAYPYACPNIEFHWKIDKFTDIGIFSMKQSTSKVTLEETQF